MWLKIRKNKINKLRKIPQFQEVSGLKINKNKETLDYLKTETIGDYIYVYMGIFDLSNKNRINPSSQEEKNKWNSFKNDNNFEVVNELPAI